jgi:hypothetical protein
VRLTVRPDEHVAEHAADRLRALVSTLQEVACRSISVWIARVRTRCPGAATATRDAIAALTIAAVMPVLRYAHAETL